MASRFWVGGTGNWDGTTASSAHWGTASGGGTTPTTGPGASDTATFDGSSGGGTVTVTGDVTCQSITCGAFTGTLDWSANNKNVTLSTATGFSGTGTGTRTINLGNGNWNLTSTSGGTLWNLATTTNLTFNANSSTIALTGATAGSQHTFSGGGLTYNNVTFSSTTGSECQIASAANTFNALTLSAGCVMYLPGGVTQTLTSLVSTGTSSTPNLLQCTTAGFQATLSCASGTISPSWTGFHGIVGTGGATFTATNSFDLGRNSGITITAPSTAGGMLVHPDMSGGMRG